MKYKILAVDMDGTLLNDDKHISEYNLKMIDKAVNKGVKFVVSSGRVPSGLRFYEGTISKNQPMICCNGAIILDEKRDSILSNTIKKEYILPIIDILREEKDTYFHFYGEDTIYSERFELATEKLYKFNRELDRKHRLNIGIIADSKEFIKSNKLDIGKIVVIDKDQSYLERLRRRIDRIAGVETTKSSIDNIEIISRGVSKGSALRLLAKHYGISVNECIAVGNDENDVSMIKCAGLGVAVDNAREHIKQIAGFITEKNNNDGAVGEVIEKFILND